MENNWEQDLQETFSSLKDDIKTYLFMAREEGVKSARSQSAYEAAKEEGRQEARTACGCDKCSFTAR